jgi:predicted ATPase
VALHVAVEDPTRLRQRLGQRYHAVLDQCRHLLRAAVSGAASVDVDADAETLSAVFADASQALGAAVNVQRSLAAQDWPNGGQVRARVALHAFLSSATAVAARAGSSRAEQIAEIAHGGQILLSDALRVAVDHHLPAGVALFDLGRQRLEHGGEEERLYQAVAPDLASDFPPLRVPDASPNNLPAESTEFVGRRNELRRVRALLAESRLLTLIGPGGTGKTRLALRAAAQLLPDFPDGVYFVPLATASNAAMLGPAIAASLGLPEAKERPAMDAVIEQLAERLVLLVLDNLEQIAEAAEIARLLTESPRLRVLVTSRVALRVQAEQLFPVPPLETPAMDAAADTERLMSIDGIALFVMRARNAEPSFALTARNATAVARVVTRLEGLPLAIELAAARIQTFSPEVLSRRLERGFELLRGTARDLPARHRTLRDTVAWSYDLLDDAERAALRRLGAFAGGFTLEAMEAVVGGGEVGGAVDLLGSLINKSLVRREATQGEPRFSMLESIREFAESEL